MRITCLAVAGTALIMISSAAAEDAKVHGHPANRLAKESSPYLLLHAHNPVDWYPWGPEAFEKAQKEDKPVFLSIGYSSCYWCHVMERKVFSDAAIAKYMNEHFVNIKVDREERPDVDDIYMTSLLVYQQLAGSASGGGWPLSMFLTPDGNPIAGATYLPPADSAQGRGFPGVAKHISGLWKDRKPELQRSALQIAEQVQRMTRPGLELQPILPVASLVDAAVLQVKELYDPVWGGVGFHKERPHTPKFPNVSRLELLLDIYESSGDKELLKIVEQSLHHMANGGIRDHLGGGFHRYSTDRKWHVPHFEKMLYDQAMLLGIYARAAKITNNETYAVVASEITAFIRREMTTPDGAFCSALDAETNAIEGEYYVWSTDQIEAILGKDDAAIFAAAYGLNESNPFEHGFVLHLPRSLHDTASQLKMSPGELEKRLAPMRAQLLNSRDQRERPLLDDKVLTAWNALMIRALAVSGRDLNRTSDIELAKNATEFLLKNLRDKDGRLLRTWRNGEAKFPAYLDDYAFLVAALLELHKTTSEDRWLTEARTLAELQNDLFYDSELQAFYYTANNHEKLIARISSVYDSVFPSANSISVFNLIRLNELNHSEAMITIAENTLTRFAATLERAPASCSSLAQALHLWLSTNAAADPLQSSFPEPQSRRFQLASLSDESPKQPKPPAKDPQQRATFRPVIGGAPGNGFAEDDKPKPLKVKIYPMYNKLPRKGKCLVAIELQVKLGWHINANPSHPDFLVPTKVEVKSKQKVKLTKIKYPKHHELKVDGFDQPYHVYDGKTIVYGLLEIDETNTTKFTELEFHVTFQGCNSTQCLPPDLVVMKGKLPVAAEGEELKKIHRDKFPKPPAKKETLAPPK